MEKKQLKFIDLFAGIGGMRIPFEELGGKCVFSSEIDKHCQRTYEANFGEMPTGDITKLSADSIPYHDLLLAGFPCQAFSQGGRKQGFQDERGQLFFQVAKILNDHRPQAILLENVKGLRGHDKGRTLQMILYVLEKLNYVVSWKIISATDFNLPQKRERIFIVGFQDKNNKNLIFDFPKPIELTAKVGDLLEKEVDEKYTITDRMWEGHQNRKKAHRKRGNGFGFSLVNRNSSYTRTISARYYKDGSEVLVEQANKNPRVLTPRECARLQGFPESFVIPVSDCQAWRQFGNSVPVSVIRAIAQKMLSYIDLTEQQKEFKKVDLDQVITQKKKQLYPEDYQEQFIQKELALL
ncbi:DNA cytosine methyltransferase [Dactylococcopsis salina]|uniref:Type II methyltransferase M.DsaV n=2 Tax=Dactylococcopsis salina TaxID=292566 RepID=MTD5_DACSA|nr:DNA cytosine methyltransferase [Dactylococcopsis salina]P50185.1 RecName: Full=Type II methyltransferase M.DsaV; Short=M.DsaV; AltName: Full=Cytosine-specific methyltransferase DsaV; AltName: Full=Modification methylase DsaV [Dactylococcopsis salina]AAA86046.1 DsaV methyltransferase [Dactylococcopsis salina]AFZ49531.1 DNA-methyltransferase Dcm [Dactylococcopsis salina PCC 8305]